MWDVALKFIERFSVPVFLTCLFIRFGSQALMPEVDKKYLWNLRGDYEREIMFVLILTFFMILWMVTTKVWQTMIKRWEVAFAVGRFTFEIERETTGLAVGVRIGRHTDSTVSTMIIEDSDIPAIIAGLTDTRKKIADKEDRRDHPKKTGRPLC